MTHVERMFASLSRREAAFNAEVDRMCAEIGQASNRLAEVAAAIDVRQPSAVDVLAAHLADEVAALRRRIWRRAG